MAYEDASAPGGAPTSVPGGLPENRGEDLGDVNREPAVAGDARRDELVQLLNRLVMIEGHCADMMQHLVRDEEDPPTRDRLQAVLDEDRRAIDVAERAIRDLGGKPSAARRTAGVLASRTRFLLESLPARAKEVVKKRDLDAGKRKPEYVRFVDLIDAYSAEVASHAHWRVLKRVAEESGERALLDAANEAEAAADAHVAWLEERVLERARVRFVTGVMR